MTTTLSFGRMPLFSEYRDVPWLARRYAITSIPSLSALTTLRSVSRAPLERRSFVGFGDPYFSQAQAHEADENAAGATQMVTSRDDVGARSLRTRFRDVVVSPGAGVETSRLWMLPRLPDTRDEILSMAAAMGADLGQDVFLGTAANEQTVKTKDLSRYRVIAFATHGLTSGDLDGLTQPALALTAPEVAGIEGDGLLTMEEILALRLNADWIVLSAWAVHCSRRRGTPHARSPPLNPRCRYLDKVVVSGWVEAPNQRQRPCVRGAPAVRGTSRGRSAIGQFERALIGDRIRSGLQRARALGKVMGRPRTVVRTDQVLALRNEGLSYRAIGRRLTISPALAHRLARKPSNNGH